MVEKSTMPSKFGIINPGLLEFFSVCIIVTDYALDHPLKTVTQRQACSRNTLLFWNTWH